MTLFIILIALLTSAIIAIGLGTGWITAKVESERWRPSTIPLKKMQDALGIAEHAHRVIVNGKPVYFDSGGKEIK